MNKPPRGDFGLSAPLWMRRIGVQSWLFVGFVLSFSVFLAIFSLLNDLLIPLIISLLLAILFRPMVDWLEDKKIPRILGTVLTLLFIFSVMIGLVLILLLGIVQQGPEIAYQLQAGWENLQVWLSQFEIILPSPEVASKALMEALPTLFDGLFGFLSSTLSTLISLAVGLYFGAFILFFFLRDAGMIQNWLSNRVRISSQAGANIVQEAGQTIFIYFRGTALTALITSIVVGIPLIWLNVPLVGSILIIYFFTSFIPYLGAWIAGAFAVLIALGSGGIETALIILIAVMVSNGILQAVVSSWALGSMLKIHPLLIFLVTIIAGIVGGILLMILAVPLTAIGMQIISNLSQEGMFSDESSLNIEDTAA